MSAISWAVVRQSEIQLGRWAVGLYKRTSACLTDAVWGAAVRQFATRMRSDKGPTGRTPPALCAPGSCPTYHGPRPSRGWGGDPQRHSRPG